MKLVSTVSTAVGAALSSGYSASYCRDATYTVCIHCIRCSHWFSAEAYAVHVGAVRPKSPLLYFTGYSGYSGYKYDKYLYFSMLQCSHWPSVLNPLESEWIQNAGSAFHPRAGRLAAK